MGQVVRKMKYSLSTVLLLLLLWKFSPTVFAQEPVTLSLRECIEEGLNNNFAIRIMRNNRQQADNNATRGNAGQLPTLNLSASYSGTDYGVNAHYPDGTSSYSSSFNNNTAVGVDLSWTVFNGFSLVATYDKLQELKFQGELDMRLTLEDFVASVSNEYYNLIRQRIRLSNLKQSVSLSRERLRIVQESYQIGAASGLDYQQAQVDFNADTSDYLSQTELVRKAEIQLNELMAYPQLERRMMPADTAIVPDASLNKDDLWEKTNQNNVSLLQAMSNQAVAQLDYKRIKSRNYPYFKISAGVAQRNYWYTSGTYQSQSQLGPTLGASAGIALFDGGNRRREQRNARLDIENRNLQVEQMEQALRADLAALWMAYDNNLQLWEIEKRNLLVARSNFSIAMERYRLRELSGIELREAQLSLLTSEERLSTVEYNIKVCEISLHLLSGEILK